MNNKKKTDLEVPRAVMPIPCYDFDKAMKLYVCGAGKGAPFFPLVCDLMIPLLTG